MLVEMVICTKNQTLEYYDSGADLFSDYYRVIFPNKNGNTKIVIDSDNPVLDYFENTKIIACDFDLNKFVTHEGNGHFSDLPPFNYAIVEDSEGKQYLFKNEDIQFFHTDDY